jgi:hypothetical protein
MPVALPRSGPLTGQLKGNSQRTQVAPPSSKALPFLPSHLPQPTAQPLIEFLEDRGRVGQRKVGRPAAAEAVDRSYPPLHRDGQLREVRRRKRSLARLWALGSILTLTLPPRLKKPNPSKVRRVARSTADLSRLTAASGVAR